MAVFGGIRSPSELAGSRRTDYSDAWRPAPQRQPRFPQHPLLVIAVLQRSPVVLVLLAAATLALDAVAIHWLQMEPTAIAAGAFYDALCFSQLGLACLYVVFNPGRRIFGSVILAAVLLCVTTTTARLLDYGPWEMVAYFGTYVTLLILSAWTVKHTKLWPARDRATRGIWQFSVGQLLTLMTVLAVLLTLFRGVVIIPGADVAADVVTSTALVVAVVVIWARPWILPLRLAALLFAAGLFGLADWVHGWWSPNPNLPTQANDISISIGDSLIQALVVFIWLEVGRIIPSAADSGTQDDTSPAF
jgi:hypothetical protein